jgi:hypothetical protein
VSLGNGLAASHSLFTAATASSQAISSIPVYIQQCNCYLYVAIPISREMKDEITYVSPVNAARSRIDRQKDIFIKQGAVDRLLLQPLY